LQNEPFPEYVLVAQDEVLIEKCYRQNADWLYTKASDKQESITLASIKCELTLSKIDMNAV
jgi:hypothetical protein